MYDTIEIISPVLSDKLIYDIKYKSMVTQRIDMETGEVMYQLTTSELKGSYDARLSVRVVSENRVKIGGSVHKFILGHNCFGGPKDLKKCCRYLVALSVQKLGLCLPNWSEWELMRVDVTHVFNLGSKESAEDFMRMMRGCRYPRRETLNFGVNSYYFAGASTTIKMYIKGPEFKVHDKKRLLNNRDLMYTKDTINFLERMSNQLLRCEVEVRRRKMKYDGISFKCKDLDDEYFNNVYIKEMKKILREGESDMTIVRDIMGVKERLKSVYDVRKANNLFAVWSRIQLEGEQSVRNSVSRMTYYRYKKDFEKAGVGMQGALKVIGNCPVEKMSRLYDFIPLPGERYHVDGVFCDVDLAIKQLELSA